MKHEVEYKYKSSLLKLIPYAADCKWLIMGGFFSMLVIAMLTVGFGQAMRHFVDGIPSSKQDASLYFDKLFLIAIGIISIYFFASFFRLYLIQLVSIRVSSALRSDVFESIMRAGPSYIEKHSSGDIQTHLIADTAALADFLARQIPRFIKGIFMIAASMAACFYVSVKLSLIVFVALPIVVLPFILASKSLRKVSRQQYNVQASLGSFAGEVFRGIKLVYVFSKLNIEISRFTSKINEFVQYAIQSARKETFLSSLVESLSFVCLAFLLWAASNDVLRGGLTIGDLIAFGFYVQAMVIAAKNLVDVSTAFNIASGISERVVEYLTIKNPVEKKHIDGNISNSHLNGAIEFDKVSFSYPSRPDVIVLDELSFKIKPGVRTAIVGSSGAGKSTLIELLLRIYDPDSGSIRIDGLEVSSINPDTLYQNIGYMPQQSGLRSGSVLDNIVFGLSDVDLSLVRAAARRAQADEFISLLPQGYETDIGEAGARLSGGQMQRISLARVLLREPCILLLDEPTSALDEANEKQVEDALSAILADGKTTILQVTHNIRTAKNADNVLVLVKGRVVAQGAYEELCAVSDQYGEMPSNFEYQNPPEKGLLTTF